MYRFNYHTTVCSLLIFTCSPQHCLFRIQMYRWQDQGEFPILPFGSLTLFMLHIWINHIRLLCHLLCFTSGVRRLLKLPGACPVLGTKLPSVRPHLWLTVKHQYSLSLSPTYNHRSTASPAWNPIFNQIMRSVEHRPPPRQLSNNIHQTSEEKFLIHCKWSWSAAKY